MNVKCLQNTGKWAFAALIAALTASCASDDADSPGVVRFSSTEMHAAHSEELLPVMHELTRLAVVETDALGNDEESARTQRRTARGILGKIAAAAEDIPDHLKTTNMRLEHRALFKHMAMELHGAANAFRDDIRTMPLAEIKPRFAELQQKCDACHRKFRIAPFPVSGGVPFD